MKNLHNSATEIRGGFWKRYQDLVRNVTIHSIYKRFVETGRFAALSCDWKAGDPRKPDIYWDSDVAKWIESVAYLTQARREPALEAIVDALAATIARNQRPDGYFNSYFLSVEPDGRFTDRDNHELYCAGHLIEAAIAYHRATGKAPLLNAAIRYADLIYRVFYVERSAPFTTPGHEEIELALLKLAEYSGDSKYRTLAEYFIDERARHPAESAGSVYLPVMTQSDVPVRKMRDASGHAVRACYLYAAMAALAKQHNNAQLEKVCKDVFASIADRKMSITGGVGACIAGEAFDMDYLLPNLDSYNETCAAIALAMFAGEMQNSEARVEYADVIERIWYNGMLSGISLDGDAFFYENALEIDLRLYDHRLYGLENASAYETHRRGRLHARRLQRAKVFECSCCPPNLCRMIASAPRYMYSVDENTIYCHQFAQARTEFVMDAKPAVLEQYTNYPIDGKIRFVYHGARARLAVRIPGWCAEYEGATEGGYALFPLADGAEVNLELPMEVHFVEADPRVREAAGKCAVTRGPLVYCMESIDNGKALWSLELRAQAKARLVDSERFGAPVIEIDAQRGLCGDALYRIRDERREACVARLIPYFAFANRGVSDMQIWTPVV